MKKPTVIRKALWALVVLAVGFASAAEDLLDNVQWITTAGTDAVHSFPAFSEDGRYILATARGDAYGSTCDHVYRFDRDLDNPQPISLVSTGIGEEKGTTVNAGLSTDSNARQNLYVVLSNVEKVMKTPVDLNAVPETVYCNAAASKCADPANSATCQSLYIERFATSLNYAVSTAFGLRKMYAMSDATQWDSLRGASGQYLVGTRLKNDNEEIKVIGFDKPKVLSHEVSWADGFAIEKDSKRVYYSAAPRPGTIKTGFVAVTGARIFMTNIMDADPKETLIASHPDHFYVWPSVSPGAPRTLIATRLTTATAAKAVVRFKLREDGTIETATAGVTDGNEEVLAENAWHGQLSMDGKMLTFVSSREGKTHQIYVASVKAVAADKPAMDPPSKQAAIAHNINDFEHLSGGLLFNLDHFMNMPTSVRISNDRETLMFATDTSPGNCPQIYQVRRQAKDDFAFRKMSSGLHIFSSPDFISNTKNILYSGALQRSVVVKDGCPLTCADPTFSTNFCQKGKRVRLIPKESEILEANEFGSIRQRWTNNAVWDGEIRVAPDGLKAAFVRRDGDGFKLFLLRFDADKEAKFLELELTFDPAQTGFIFDISFDADSKKLVYATTRIAAEDAANKKIATDLLAKELVHIPYSSIHVYDIANRKEYLIQNGGTTSYLRSPHFSENGKAIYYLATSWQETADDKNTYMWKNEIDSALVASAHKSLGLISATEDVTMSILGHRYAAVSPVGVVTALFDEKLPAPVVPPPPDCPDPPPPPPPVKDNSTTTTPKPETKEKKKKSDNSASTAAASLLSLMAAVLLKAL